MSRAFVINGDEWGYCIRMSRKCSGADPEGHCMRTECAEEEKTGRSMEEIRRAKMEEALKELEERKRTEELREKIARAKVIAAERRKMREEEKE